MSNSLVHGGRLNAAAQQWGIPPGEWLDLSTGINPRAWAVPAIPPERWQRLPEDDDGLNDTIREWADLPAGADGLPVAGSQAAIQALPRLRSPCRVGVPAPGYEEHGHCWRSAGHEVRPFSSTAIENLLDELDVVIWIQPNNPTGEVVPRDRLLAWHRRLAARGGWLIIDEAFVSGTEADSLAAHTELPGLIILRSLGKFFGLAGIRAGAVLARPELCRQLDQMLGPWCLSGPTRYVMSAALRDSAWQAKTATWLEASGQRLHALLSNHGLPPTGGASLFQYVCNQDSKRIADALARMGILVRYFESPLALRFGLPGTEMEWQRLALALEHSEIQHLVAGFRP